MKETKFEVGDVVTVLSGDHTFGWNDDMQELIGTSAVVEEVNTDIPGYDEVGYKVGEWWWSENALISVNKFNPTESKEIVKEDDPMYTVDEVFFAIKQHVGYESPLDYKDGIKSLLKRLKEDPEYKEYLRLKAIYG